MQQSALRRSLNHRPVSHRVAKRHAKLYDSRARSCQLDEQFTCRLKIGIACCDERNQAAPSFALQASECCFNPAHKKSLASPSSLSSLASLSYLSNQADSPDLPDSIDSATVFTSLSPRPERLRSEERRVGKE